MSGSIDVMRACMCLYVCESVRFRPPTSERASGPLPACMKQKDKIKQVHRVYIMWEGRWVRTLHWISYSYPGCCAGLRAPFTCVGGEDGVCGDLWAGQGGKGKVKEVVEGGESEYVCGMKGEKEGEREIEKEMDSQVADKDDSIF